MKIHNNTFGYLILTGLLFGAALESNAQKSKQSRLEEKTENKRIKFSGSSVHSQLGGHCIFNGVLGGGVMVDFVRVFRRSPYLEVAVGYFPIISSITYIHIGAKCKLFDLKAISGYGGAGVNIYTKTGSSTLWAPSLFGELSIGISAKLSLAVRAEPVFVILGDVGILFAITNLSVGLRRTL